MARKKNPHQPVNLRLFGLFLAVLLLFIGFREITKLQQRKKLIDLPQIHVLGELRALTLSSSTSYFIYRDKEMGYEYELCSMLANDLGLQLRMVAAPNLAAMIQMLERGEGDMIAYNIPITQENKGNFLYCGREFLTHQVLVQQKKPANEMIRSVTGLIGKNVVVHNNSRYLSRLNHLNDELGGGILIKVLPDDSLSVEDLIGLVSKGQIDYTIADNNTAQFNSTFFSNINTSVAISFSQPSSWAARKTSPKLASAINRWFKQNMKTVKYHAVTRKYFEVEKNTTNLIRKALFPLRKGQLSMYDDLFRYFGGQIGWDWKLLASIAYQESNFDPTAINWTGASGLMQIMPKTARSVGVSKDSLFKPAQSVLAASRLLKIYEKSFTSISNEEQRIKMTLASYNCGLGHVMDARALTRKHGKNPFLWKDNVEKFILLKSRPEYYEDPVCKQGYLRGTETAAFVNEVWERYKEYERLLPDTGKRSKK